MHRWYINKGTSFIERTSVENEPKDINEEEEQNLGKHNHNNKHKHQAYSLSELDSQRFLELEKELSDLTSSTPSLSINCRNNYLVRGLVSICATWSDTWTKLTIMCPLWTVSRTKQRSSSTSFIFEY